MDQNMIYDVSYMEAIKRGFKQYAIFSGRASRSEFWRFIVSREIVLDGMAVFSSIVDMILGNTSDVSDYILALIIILHLIYLLPTLAITCRRLHDVGKSGLTFLLVFIPIIGVFVLLSNLVKKGDNAINVYGDKTGYTAITPIMEQKVGLEHTPTLREDILMGALAIILYIWIFTQQFIASAWISFNSRGVL
ncbi:DUF805 domain-containing protein [uncultured Veillonella sp.]|uniref:DUF805 domain-containing protein n=1 Tax=uncultured Veillonella sp. TaxID=159268 RepID=UPI0025F46B87|nr:DUF805 domain-containing protein [uncultured Veillonella sp.]